jgi:TPR repeat protein
MKTILKLKAKLILFSAVFAVGLAVTGCSTTGTGGKSVEELTAAANSGDPNASLKLADHYYKQKQYKEAEQWYKKSAEQFKSK